MDLVKYIKRTKSATAASSINTHKNGIFSTQMKKHPRLKACCDGKKQAIEKRHQQYIDDNNKKKTIQSRSNFKNENALAQ